MSRIPPRLPGTYPTARPPPLKAAPAVPVAPPVRPEIAARNIPASNTPPVEWFIGGAVVLVVGTLLVYLRAIRGGFIWDDNYLVWDNVINRASDGLHRIWFTREPFDFWPVSASVFWMEWQKWGSDPLAYHLQNVLLHIFNAVLFWLVLRKLSVRGAWLASAIFAFHPVCVETVGWIAELKTVLSTFLGLLAILVYLNFVEKPRVWKYSIALVLFAAALLAKSSLAGLPVLILAYDWWQQGTLDRRAIVRATPFFVVALVTSILTVLYQRYSTSRHDVCVDTPANFLVRLAGAGWAVWFYFYKTLLPIHLVEIYPHWHIPWLNRLSYLPDLALLAALAVAWRFRRGWGRPVLVWLVGFLALTFPILGFFDMSYMMHSLVADHFQYQAMMLTIATAVALACHGAAHLHRGYRLTLGGLCVTGLVVLAILSQSRAAVVADQEPLWRDTIARNPKAWMAYYELGTELALQSDKLADSGQPAQATDRRNEAIDVYRRGAALQPDYPYTWSNLAVVLGRLGRFDEAAESYRHAVRLMPDDIQTAYNLADLFVTAGKSDDAIVWLRRTLELTHGQHVPAQLALAEQLIRKQDDASIDEARKHLLAALNVQPDALLPMLGLAQIYFHQNNTPEAERWLNMALAKYPNLPAVRKNAGDLLVRMQRNDEAIAQYEALDQLGGSDADSLSNLGLLLTQRGNVDDAIKYLEEAIKLNPLHPAAFNNLGFAFERAGKLDQAIAAYQRSLMLQSENNAAKANLERVEDEKRRTFP